jgi:hypothetical protein
MREVASATVAVAMAALVGCGGSREFAEVEGRVTLDGQPLTDVEIVFLPDPARGNQGNNASAYPDADGRYRLQALRDNRAGTVLGPHRVVVLDLTAIVPPGGQAGSKPRRFPPKYGAATDTVQGRGDQVRQTDLGFRRQVQGKMSRARGGDATSRGGP